MNDVGELQRLLAIAIEYQYPPASIRDIRNRLAAAEFKAAYRAAKIRLRSLF